MNNPAHKPNQSIHRGETLRTMADYILPPYEFTKIVENFLLLPRFGHGSDFTRLFSLNHEDQVDYAVGLVALFLFLLMFFVFWIIMLATFKVMGPANAGFLSGHHFVVLNPINDKRNICKRYVFLMVACSSPH
jgi:hypothetical protein